MGGGGGGGAALVLVPFSAEKRKSEYVPSDKIIRNSLYRTIHVPPVSFSSSLSFRRAFTAASNGFPVSFG